MKSTRTIQFHRRAVMALLSFPRGTRARIERQLENFAAGPAAVRPPDVRRIDEDEPVYLLRVTPSIRAIFQEEPDGFEVQDVVRTDTLRSFARQEP